MADFNDDNSFTTTSQGNTASPESKPGRRIKNPLGYFSSYTYQISLYMVTPAAYSVFVESGKRQINAAQSGVYLVAQSGGINKSDIPRVPGMDFDYHIDNLTIKTYANPKATMSETNSTEVKFQIIEPYSFSFITKLKEASDFIQKQSNATYSDYLRNNPSKQFFVLGIRFLGYDENGKVMSGEATYEESELDANASELGLFERYFDILIAGIKFKIDGSVTTYNISAFSVSPKVGFGVKRGLLRFNTTVEGETIEQALSHNSPKGLLARLNDFEQDLLKQDPPAIEHANRYEIEFVGEGADQIKNAKIVTEEDLVTSKWAPSKANTSAQSNIAKEVESDPDNTKRTVSFKNDTPIVQAVSSVISQSTYLRDALNLVYENTTQPSTTGDGYDSSTPNTNKDIAWYNLSVEITDPVWDNKRKDFAYKIKYIVKRYDTPVLQSVYSNKGFTYYGPYKRYDYWYTGLNSEILSYEQTIDNLYFTYVLANNPIATNLQNDSTPPVEPGSPTGQDRSGAINTGKESQNNYLTNLYDPSSYAMAKINIMGDPDFLMPEPIGSIDEVYSKFYGNDGFTVNPTGGQVFIEIDFKEGIDYDYAKGYLTINDRILFWDYPEDIAKIVKGVSYTVLEISSQFSNGVFQQTLTCYLNTFGGAAFDRSQRVDNTNVGLTVSTNVNTAQGTPYVGPPVPDSIQEGPEN